MEKRKYTKILTLMVFVYIILQLSMTFLGKNVNTMVLKSEKVDGKIKTKGLVIREEYVLTSESSGKLELLVKEGEKVKKEQKLANIYSGKVDSSINTEIEVLNEEINDIKSGENNISKEEIKKLNLDIEKISSDMRLNIVDDNYKSIDKKDIDKKISDRNRLLNNSIDSKNLESKENNKKILTTKLDKNLNTIISNISGIISYKADGNEDKYGLENIEQITKEDINKADNKYEEVSKDGENIKENQSIVRLVGDNNYVAICIENKELENFEINNKIKLKYSKYENDAIVYKIYPKDDYCVIILKISNQNVGIYDTRVEEFDIIYKQTEGLKVPKSSVEIIDGKQGVYVVNPETKNAQFIELQGIVYEEDDFVYIDYYKNDINQIKSIDVYDEIILKPNIINKNIKIK